MSKFSNALHKLFGFVKVKEPEVEAVMAKARAYADAIMHKAEVDAQAVRDSKAADDLKKALALVSNFVSDKINTSPTPPAPPATPGA